MGLVLFVLFLAIPLIETALFIVVGGQIGVFATIAIVIATAVIGVFLVRSQGLATLSRARADIDAGVMPARAMAEGLAILAAGALLVVPGFLTDTIGFALLVPPLRRLVIAGLGGLIAARAGIVDIRAGASRQRARGPRGTVIDGEAVEIEEPPPRPLPRNRPSPWREG